MHISTFCDRVFFGNALHIKASYMEPLEYSFIVKKNLTSVDAARLRNLHRKTWAAMN